jgi:hypothetical protein
MMGFNLEVFYVQNVVTFIKYSQAEYQVLPRNVVTNKNVLFRRILNNTAWENVLNKG